MFHDAFVTEQHLASEEFLTYLLDSLSTFKNDNFDNVLVQRYLEQALANINLIYLDDQNPRNAVEFTRYLVKNNLSGVIFRLLDFQKQMDPYTLCITFKLIINMITVKEEINELLFTKEVLTQFFRILRSEACVEVTSQIYKTLLYLMGDSVKIRDMIFIPELMSFLLSELNKHEHLFYKSNDKINRFECKNDTQDVQYEQVFKSVTEYKKSTFCYLLCLVCQGANINPIMSLEAFEIVLETTCKVIANYHLFIADMICIPLAFLQTYTNQASEQCLVSNYPLLKSVVPTLVEMCHSCTYSNSKCGTAISILTNLLSVNGNEYADAIEETNFVFIVEWVFGELGMTLEFETMYIILYNLFSGDSGLKRKVLNSHTIMDALMEEFVQEDQYEGKAIACLRNLFKGAYCGEVEAYFMRNCALFGECVALFNDCKDVCYLDNLKHLMCDLLTLDSVIRERGERMIDFDKLKGSEQFFQGYLRIEKYANEKRDHMWEEIEQKIRKMCEMEC